MKVIFQNTSLAFKSVQKTVVTVVFDGTSNKQYVTDFDFVANKRYSIKWVSASADPGTRVGKNIFVKDHVSPSAASYIHETVEFQPTDSGKMVVFSGTTVLDLGTCVWEIVEIEPVS